MKEGMAPKGIWGNSGFLELLRAAPGAGVYHRILYR